MPKITCLTDFYACADFTVFEGETVEVTDDKAAQLAEDFPTWFKIERPAARARTTEAKPSTTDASAKTRTRAAKAS